MDAGSLTRADLVELLGALETRLKAEMAELKTDMVELKTDMADLKTEMRADFATKAELKAELAATEQRLTDAVQEQVRDSQTEILKAFLPYQETTNVRFRGMDAKVANTEAELRARMEILERRLEQIETRLLLNPPTA